MAIDPRSAHFTYTTSWGLKLLFQRFPLTTTAGRDIPGVYVLVRLIFMDEEKRNLKDVVYDHIHAGFSDTDVHEAIYNDLHEAAIEAREPDHLLFVHKDDLHGEEERITEDLRLHLTKEGGSSPQPPAQG